MIKPKPPTLRELVERLVVDVADIKIRLSTLENTVSQLKIDNNLK